MSQYAHDSVVHFLTNIQVMLIDKVATLIGCSVQYI
jgi:hypothetical protein